MIRNIFLRSGSYDTQKATTFSQRRPAIVSQHFDYDENKVKNITKYPKTREDEIFIKSALENNDFLCQLLENKGLQDIIDCMCPKEVNPNEIVIRQGEAGSHLYISVKGTFEIIIDEVIVSTFSDVRVFGELALLYDAKRLATIKARTWGKMWVLDQSAFKTCMIISEVEKRGELLAFLEKVPKLNQVKREVLEEVANLLQPQFFTAGIPIIKEGDKKTEKFFIIKAGSVTVSKKAEGPIDKLYSGDFFGELALLNQDERKATITADPPGTECLILTREEFMNHFGDIPDCFSINFQVQPYKPMETIISEHTDLSLNDFETIAVLGKGGFGRVDLVQHNSRKELVFALKSISKQFVISGGHQDHIFNEKNIQMGCKNDFIVRLYRTFTDSKYLYILLEPCLGGDVWSVLHRRKISKFNEDHARFYTACVVEALNYLHQRQTIYRDLKPENLLLTHKGYIKITDFGFAKNLLLKKKTYSFVGTPEYVAPEIILNQGHDKAVDYWSLGILIYEFLSGKTPFNTSDASYMKTYRNILIGFNEVRFPQYFSQDARRIIRNLCKTIPAQRLGCLVGEIEDIKKDNWFKGFQWDKLRERSLPAPFKPNLRNSTDTQYFEKISKDRMDPGDVTCEWEKDF